MNEPIILSHKAMSRMTFHNAWRAAEAPRRGLRDPWEHRPDGIISEKEILTLIEGKEVKGTEVVYRKASSEEMNAWREERDEYMRQRDEWLALKMFNKFGYDTFLEECEAYHLTDEFCHSVRPCDSIGAP